MFATKEFIDATRDFVCVRIDSYESKEHQEYVRTFLDGRFENSAFCLLTPDGQDWLSRGGRGPEMVLGRSATSRMKEVSSRFKVKGDLKEALVQDFHSLRQALNVASADQRVLVLVHGSKEELKAARDSLKTVANDKRIIGRFHFDFEESAKLSKSVSGISKKSAVSLIKPSEFGLKGDVTRQLALSASTDSLIDALLKANTDFASSTAKKVYSRHVSKGRQLGIYFEGAVPYGEDRDGDGQIDSQVRRGGSPRRGPPPRRR